MAGPIGSMKNVTMWFLSEICVSVIIVGLIITEIEGKQKSTSSEKQSVQTPDNVVNKEAGKGTGEDLELEKQPHFLVWKLLSKVLLLTILRATRRIWQNGYSAFGYGYAIYLLCTLAMWLHICFDLFMEYLSSLSKSRYEIL